MKLKDQIAQAKRTAPEGLSQACDADGHQRRAVPRRAADPLALARGAVMLKLAAAILLGTWLCSLFHRDFQGKC